MNFLNNWKQERKERAAFNKILREKRKTAYRQAYAKEMERKAAKDARADVNKPSLFARFSNFAARQQAPRRRTRNREDISTSFFGI